MTRVRRLRPPGSPTPGYLYVAYTPEISVQLDESIEVEELAPRAGSEISVQLDESIELDAPNYAATLATPPQPNYAEIRRQQIERAAEFG